MEHRLLGRSGFSVPVITFGTAGFGGTGDFWEAWSASSRTDAKRFVDICIEAGANMFDSADGYGGGDSETFLGEAIRGRQNEVLISTKATFPNGPGPNDVGGSRYHLVNAVEQSLMRLGVDHIDLFQLHAFDAKTPLEETLHAFDDLVTAGKIRYIGCSNYSGWHLMKSLATSDRYGWTRMVAHQAYYSLIGRDFEHELMPLALEEGVGTTVWSPLGWGRLTGKIRRGAPWPEVSRLPATAAGGPPVDDEYLYDVVAVIDEIAAETGKSVPQISLNWLLQRPSVSTVIIGARTEEQLKDNLGAIGWSLTEDQMARLDAVSDRPWPYPYWHQRHFRTRNPFPTDR